MRPGGPGPPRRGRPSRRYPDQSEAITRANDTRYGLQAGIFTAALETALDVAERLRVGAVMINESSDFRIDAMPFGGPKRSGVGREGVRYAVEAMTEPKVVAVRRSA
ncbi:aldehyde dehydrogenase family protein [Streptomyces violaceusniger]